jgi:hypothetical protein
MTDLITHIRSLNEQSKAEMEANPGVWIGMLVEDPTHWAEQGVHTVEDFERMQLCTMIYEGHKDAFGFKGRHYDFDSMSMDELRAEADRIGQAIEETMARERLEQQFALGDFELRVQENITMGAITRQDAIRWILQAEGLDKERDADYICYSLGLPYSVKDMFKEYVV